MEELFNILSCGAKFNKSNSKKNKEKLLPVAVACNSGSYCPIPEVRFVSNKDTTAESAHSSKKKKHSIEKQQQIHREEMAAFRRRLNIHLGKHCDTSIDPISSFEEMTQPTWWKEQENTTSAFHALKRVILQNLEQGKWLEPTPIQMQCIPALLNGRKDILGAAPTGSGKSGAFILPALLLAAAPTTIFYGTSSPSSEKEEDKEGQIRTLLLAPSRELASQLHREVCRLGFGYKKGGLRAVLLSKQNASVFVSGKLGGKRGVDVLVSTPLRLVAALSSSNESAASCAPLSSVRLIVLDEADRLLDATDGSTTTGVTNENEQNKRQSGAARVRTFVEQIDDILAACPKTAIRALFSATMGSNVRNLAESILRNPIDVTIRPSSTCTMNGANPDIDQKLFFVGKEEGKLLAIRQLIQKGIRPPVLIFLQSKERAQALFGELMYDGVNVDVLHSDKSKAAREAAINKFRQGDTWFLITTDLCARGMDFKHLNVVINYDLPTNGVSYIHRIGRCGRAGRKGEAITFFTESDFDHLRTIANVMKLSGCDIPDWMLSLKKNNARKEKSNNPKRKRIDTIPSYDKKKQNNLIAKKKQKRQKLSLEEAKGEDCSSD